jgi:Ca2+-binding RTX toxin-like protein
VHNGILTYNASAGIANGLTVAVSGTNYIFTDTKEIINAPGLSGSGTHSVTLPTAFVGSMVLNLGDMSDGLVIQKTLAPITVNAGVGNDGIVVQSTLAAITVNAGDGNDAIDVGTQAGGTLSGIQAAISVDGGTGSDAVRINDPASGISRAYKVTSTDVTPGGGSAVSYSAVELLYVTSGAQGDTFNVFSTAAGTTTSLNAGAGFDTFNVGSATNTLDDIKGPLKLFGGTNFVPPHFGFPDQLNLFDQGSSVSNSYVVRDNSVARSGGVVVSYSDVESVTLNAGAAADSAVVLATSGLTSVTLNMGGGNDNINVATRTGSSLDLIAFELTVNGGDGTDTVSLNDQADTNANNYVVTATDVIRNSAAILHYATIENLTLNAGALDDTAAVQSSPTATSITLNMGAGNDTVNVGSAGGSLDPILGRVKVDGQVGDDRLFVNDSGDTDFNSYTISATDVIRNIFTIPASVVYAGTENLVVNASSGTPFDSSHSNFFFVNSTSVATTLNGALFVHNTFVIGGHSPLDLIKGELTLNDQGLSSILISDTGAVGPHDYTVSESSVIRSGAAPIHYSVAQSLQLAVSGSANNTFHVTGTAFTPVLLTLGTGNDTVTLGEGLFALDSIALPVTVVGGGGTDAIILDDQTAAFGANDYHVTSTDVTRNNREILNYSQVESLTLNAGPGDDTIRLASTAAGTPLIVRGGPGNDTFKFEGVNASGLLGSVTLDGQTGTDTLDYSGFFFPNAVRVNLAMGTATGVAGGVSNIENVIGSPGDDILIGNDQNNVLNGGPGRDILIGRGGADSLFGGVGDDILIGCSTVYDLNPAALEDLMDEWGRTDLSGTASSQYTARIKHLLGTLPDGENGTTLLKLSKLTDDGVADSLSGGEGLDWFFKLGADIITDLLATERVN